MLRKKPCFLKKINKQQHFSWLTTNHALVSQTLNIYANAINSCLCNSPTKPSANVNSSSRILNLEGFSWQKGYRTPLASISYKNTYYKFLKALHLVIRVRKKGGEIYIIFDENQYRPCSSFLTKRQSKSTGKNKLHALQNPISLFEKQKQEGLYSKKKSTLTKSLSSPSYFSSQEIIDRHPLHNSQGIGSRVDRHARLEQPNDRNVYGNLAKNLEKYENIRWSGNNWVGGTFSNKEQVLKSVNLYKTLSRQFFEVLEKSASPRYVAMAKKFYGNLFSSKQSPNAFLFSREQGKFSGFIEPLHRSKVSVTGLGRSKQSESEQSSVIARQYLRKNCVFKSRNLPDLIIVENAEKHRNVIAEAEILKIPLIAFVESDLFSNISIALPLNALKHYFLAFFLHIIYKMPSS